MPALAANRHPQDVGRRHDRAGPGRDPAAGQAIGCDVQREGRVERLARRAQDTLVDHRARPVVPLLARLEHEHHIALEALPAVREQRRRADEPGGVQIVPAGMHPARQLGGVLHPRQLVHRQRVHVPPQQHRPAGTATAQHGRDRGQLLAQRDLERETVERGEDLLLRTRQPEAELRLAVQRAAEPHEIGLEFPGAFQYGHAASTS